MSGLDDLKKKEKRSTPFSARIPKSVSLKLRELAKSRGVSQADVLIYLIEQAYGQAGPRKGKAAKSCQ